ncbi:MAG: DUF6524 family protein [Acidiferrobacterales bacterium]
MASLSEISWKGFGLRFLFGLILVFATYNPESHSYLHWIKGSFPQISAVQAFIGVVLLIGWAVFIRAAMRSLGAIGLVLALAFFGTLIWLMVDKGIIPADSIRAITYIVEFVLAAILSTGLTWSHVRRRLSGQMDTDDV